MFAKGSVVVAISVCAACAIDSEPTVDQARALEELGPIQRDARVLAGRLSPPARDPVAAARRFLADHAGALALAAREAEDFAVTGVDVDPASGLRHVTLQRVLDGVPVDHGVITVHLDADNAIFRVVSDERIALAPPRNRRLLAPLDAVRAAARALRAPITAPVALPADADRAWFRDPGASDPIAVEPRIYQVAPDDARHAYQVILQWHDDRGPRAELAMIDADDGALLSRADLVESVIPYSGLVFTASPGAAPTVDTRVLVSFGIDPATSPNGWVDGTEKTRGNNVIAATDLNHDNVVGAGETQPQANATTKRFDAAFDPTMSAALFKEASVVNAFYTVNDFHDRAYGYGFTEAARNFQTDNFGKGGTGGDEVQVDTQDGGGTNNATFQSLPEGMKPRMTLFTFSLAGGVLRDSAFDPTVLYHEASHGMSNRLVGGGAGSCLGVGQAAGMGEGWGDFLAASFLNDPVIGAYVSGNASVGVRRASMAASAFRYDDVQSGVMTEAHDAGEVWAAALWAARTAVGAAVIERLVVNGMKLTPCNPTMIHERDAILNADAVLDGSANRCALFAAFASRGLGNGAVSPSTSSTTAIVTSTTVPADCGGTTTERTFRSASTPLAIPDNNAVGVKASITVAPGALTSSRVKVDVDITHPFRGDLVIQVISPGGAVATLSNRAGGAADNFVATALDLTASFPVGTPASGTWQLFVRDLAASDVGTINKFRLSVTSP
jgi:subtilisin-like proprotein convertase family protein